MQARSLVTLEKIVAAAEALIARRGIGSLTMDAVAAEAGLSKGGVLHHFRTKEELVTNLALRKLKAVEAGINREAQVLGGQPGSTLLGMVEHASKQFGLDEGFSRALLVAAVENSSSLEQFQAMFHSVLEDVQRESADPPFGMALLFAVIGIQVSQTLGFSQLAPEQAQTIFAALRTAAQPLGRTDECQP
ncbi:TetR/AcrR family transcriptional regulator [Lichenifustis flavocetrariae]|uniref:TetR/AcrR family transcriptional regulator n=1 Tax=Lichenifustis flavocetrariae TaxID=2949735 RepID=A0AA42CJI0_9HYPH|nr:TetR/AcrR family transcriptional regulator [Lichenifustis flavocetrariae]MCW6509469.1 TetR/AcrR family transcriptional regulator [Lichenifustis flavocetrariae]